jgi:3D (Asp-Asp-Asp) domain-containing protein
MAAPQSRTSNPLSSGFDPLAFGIEIVRTGASYLADLVARIVNGIKGIAPMILAIGCESASVDPASVPPPPAPNASEQVSRLETEPSTEPQPIGRFAITFYYMIGEDEIVPKSKVANDNHADDAALASVTPPDMVTLYEPDTCEPISEVTRDFASQVALQGTGKLRDGRVLNIWGPHCSCAHSPCFKVTKNKWGNAGTGRALQPFRTVAVDPKVVKLGSLLYVPLLEGRRMPGREPWGGYVHDGCVVADDTGGFAGNKIDLFVGRKAYFLGLSGSQTSHAWARHVPVFDGSKICERKGRKVGRKSGAI